jgi:hypothetical protein
MLGVAVYVPCLIIAEGHVRVSVKELALVTTSSVLVVPLLTWMVSPETTIVVETTPPAPEAPASPVNTVNTVMK